MEKFLQENKTVKPVVTIVTVVFNDVQHIERTIKSVLEQTYTNIEYIIIDGNSTDGTVDIIKKYADHLAFWVSEKDGGIYDAMNKGIAKATGEWINFMNSGDYFLNSTIFESIFSKNHQQSEMIYGSFIGNFNGKPVKCLAYDTVKDKAWQGMPLCHQALFAQTELMKKHPFDTSFKVSADGNFVSRMIAEGHVFERVDEYIFRVGTLGYSDKNWLKARLENWTIARRYFNSWKTNYYHGKNLAKDVVFRVVKNITSKFGLYQLVRSYYRRNLQQKFPMLPPNCQPYIE